MSSFTIFGLLALASSAIAALPYQHQHHHSRRQTSNSALAPADPGAAAACMTTVTSTELVTVTITPSDSPVAPANLVPTVTTEVTVTVTADSSAIAAVAGDAIDGDAESTMTYHRIMTTITVPNSADPVPSSNSPAVAGAESTVTYTILTTITVPNLASPVPSSDTSPVAAGSASSSTPSVITSHTTQTVTVTSSSANDAAVQNVAPITTSTSTPPVNVAPTSSTSVYVPAISASSSISVASATPSAAAGAGTGKRGVAYHDASLTECFSNSPQIVWGYNWDSTPSGLSSRFKYVPLLWGTDHTSQWSTAASSAIGSGSTHLMSFNEPDLASQANLSPQEAAAAYKTYMMPFAGQAKLGAPSVTNGGGSMGLTWLSDFITACSGCQIDYVVLHWYDAASNAAYFKEHIQNATDISGGKPVWVTEIGATGSDSDVSSFLEDVMPWMDSQDFVEGYAYYMVSDGLLLSGTEPSAQGHTFANYVAS